MSAAATASTGASDTADSKAVSVSPLKPDLSEVKAAAKRLSGRILRTPLIPLNAVIPTAAAPSTAHCPQRIVLKPESLQAVGSFKCRGAGNVMLDPSADLSHGVITASAGSMATAMCWFAEQLNIKRKIVIVPDTASPAKVAAIERFGATIIRVPFSEWFTVVTTHDTSKYHNTPQSNGTAKSAEPQPLPTTAANAKASAAAAASAADVKAKVQSGAPLWLHPVCNRNVLAGNGTIALEALADDPSIDTILVPFGGGGLAIGIASAAKAINPNVRVIAVELETATPLTAARKAGSAVQTSFSPSFVDGIGSPKVLDELWPLLSSSLIDSTVVVTLKEVSEAMTVLMDRNHLIVEGAGAVSVAAALSGRIPFQCTNVMCVLSGSTIDKSKLIKLLSGETLH